MLNPLSFLNFESQKLSDLPPLKLMLSSLWPEKQRKIYNFVCLHSYSQTGSDGRKLRHNYYKKNNDLLSVDDKFGKFNNISSFVFSDYY